MIGFKAIRKGGGGYIADYYNDAGGEASTYVMDVVTALVSPVAFTPGYTLTLGMKFEQNPEGLFKLLWIDEYEHSSQDALITHLIDSSLRNCVGYVYADKNGKSGFFANIHSAGIKTSAPWRLMKAPSADDVLYGVSLTMQYINGKTINSPEASIFSKHIETLGIRDRNNISEIKTTLESPELYAFHALRFILAGIERDIMPIAKPGNVYNLHAERFAKPERIRNTTEHRKESGFFV